MSLKEDYLETDQKINGQQYCCLSFVSPEKILKNKDVYFVHKFLKTIAKKYDLDEDTIEEKYKDFVYLNEEKLESEFYEKNDFKTTIRGIKVRGSYDTLQEAQMRAKRLQSLDRAHNVYIGQVGFWLPWEPDTQKVENQEYAEGELNNLIKKYKENQDKKDIHFQENIDYAREQSEKQKKLNTESSDNSDGGTGSTEQVNSTDTSDITETTHDSLNEVDPWLARKENGGE